jgi:diguanylate cyclase (GGDEF)-like protein/PAS domain S-box-containing protein
MIPHAHPLLWFGATYMILSLAAMAFLLRIVLRQKLASPSAAGGEMHFRAMAEAIPQIVWTAIPGGGVDYCNQRWCELTGLSVEETLGWGWRKAIHPDDLPLAMENWQKSRVAGRALDMEYRIRSRAGGYRWHLVRATPLRDASGAIMKWFGSCTDIDEQMHTQQVLEEQIKQHTAALFEANERLEQESIRDPLTGLYNRRYLEDTLARETRRAVRSEHSLGVIMLDLDHFKKFNDTYGHDAGDAVLREAGAFLAKSVRAEDIVCRFGGEEFVIILPMADLHTTSTRAERIRLQLSEVRIFHQGRALGTIAVSIGVAELPQHGTSPKELLERADVALYRAKHQGRDRVVVAETATDLEAGKLAEKSSAQPTTGR